MFVAPNLLDCVHDFIEGDFATAVGIHQSEDVLNQHRPSALKRH